jgi:hypothetical protein
MLLSSDRCIEFYINEIGFQGQGQGNEGLAFEHPPA